MSNLPDPPDSLDSLIEAGADLAQALQDIVDTEPDREYLQSMLDAWEAAYARVSP